MRWTTPERVESNVATNYLQRDVFMSAKRYDLEQKEQIARMSIEGGKSGIQLAEELGINKNSI
jgi:transposase-like protein